MKKIHLIKWRANYVTNNPDEAKTSRAIKNVKWANEKTYKELKMAAHNQHKDLNTINSIVNHFLEFQANHATFFHLQSNMEK